MSSAAVVPVDGQGEAVGEGRRVGEGFGELVVRTGVGDGVIVRVETGRTDVVLGEGRAGDAETLARWWAGRCDGRGDAEAEVDADVVLINVGRGGSLRALLPEPLQAVTGRAAPSPATSKRRPRIRPPRVCVTPHTVSRGERFSPTRKNGSPR